jgi:hypothetical protein
MKKIFPIALVALFGAMTIMPSCKKSDSSPSKSLSATINGTAFTASSVQSINYSGSIFVGGFKGNAEFQFTFDSISTTTAQTYTLHPGTIGAFSASYISDTTLFLTNPSVSHDFDSGSLVITAVSSNSAKGTFTLYSTYDSTTVTNGAFSTTW